MQARAVALMRPVKSGMRSSLLIAALLFASIELIWGWPRIGWSGITPPEVTSDTPHILSLFSAIAQSLAAILALLFTISLVVSQLTHYPKLMLLAFLHRPSVVYFTAFVAAVLLPLILLTYKKPDVYATKTSLTLAVFMLLLLVPYFLSLRSRIDPGGILQRIGDEASRRVATSPARASNLVLDIYEAIMTAFVRGDFATFARGLDTLSALAVQLRRHDELFRDVLDKLRTVGRTAARELPWSLEVVRALRGAGVKIAAEGWQRDIQRRVAPALAEIGELAAERGLHDTAIDVVSALRTLGSTIAEQHHPYYTLQGVAGGLSRVGVACARNHLYSPAHSAVVGLREVGIQGASAARYGGFDDVEGEAFASAVHSLAVIAGMPNLHDPELPLGATVALWKLVHRRPSSAAVPLMHRVPRE